MQSKPWITLGISKYIHKKNICYQRYVKFKKYRNKINHLIRISKKSYYNDYLSIIQMILKWYRKGLNKLYI